MKNWPTLVYMLICFAIAMLLEMAGWGSLRWLKPAWVFILLLFFTAHYPHLINIGLAWFIGLLMDVWVGEWLGKHALIFVVVTFMVHFSFDGFAKMTFLAKLAAILILVFLYNITLVILSENSLALWAIWLPAALGGALSSTLIWCGLNLFVRHRHV